VKGEHELGPLGGPGRPHPFKRTGTSRHATINDKEMKQRITYLVKDPGSLHPSNIEVTDDSVAIKSFDGAKEHHVTLSLAELPRDVRNMKTVDLFCYRH
jgi:hypothetical protein